MVRQMITFFARKRLQLISTVLLVAVLGGFQVHLALDRALYNNQDRIDLAYHPIAFILGTLAPAVFILGPFAYWMFGRILRRFKVCEHCAETIKSNAKVCRYCGRDVAPATAEDEKRRQKTEAMQRAEQEERQRQVEARQRTKAEQRRPEAEANRLEYMQEAAAARPDTIGAISLPSVPFRDTPASNKKTTRKLYAALSVIFILSSLVAWRESVLFGSWLRYGVRVEIFSDIFYDKIVFMIAYIMIWGVGILWVLIRKSQFGAVLLLIAALFMTIPEIKMGYGREFFPFNFVVPGVELLAAIYLIMITSKSRRLNLAEEAYRQVQS